MVAKRNDSAGHSGDEPLATLSAIEHAFHHDEPLRDAEKHFLADLARLAGKAMLSASNSNQKRVTNP